MTPPKSRPPAVLRLDAEDAAIVVAPEPTIEPGDVAPVTAPTGRRRGNRWLGLLALAVGGLFLMQICLSVSRLLDELFARSDWLGWIGSALTLLATIAVIGLATREIIALSRMRQIDRLRLAGERAAQDDDAPAARALIVELDRLYRERPETAAARRDLAQHARDIVDGRDLLTLAERDLIAPIELQARGIILDSAKRVTLVTAISPRALLDVLFVLYENIRLLRRLSDLYGGRPGTLGFLRLAGRVFAHLGITGGLALSDGLMQQLIGQGVVGRLSARLGEGVVNGLLTARIGIAALDLVRPLPRLRLPRPSLGDVVTELTRLTPEKGKTDGGK